MNRQATQATDKLIIGDPVVAQRIRTLLLDLATDNWPRALRDIELLYRAVQPDSTRADWDDLETPLAAALVYSEDNGTLLERICHGPDREGNCPLASDDELVACAGKRVAMGGWDLPIAKDARRCPLAGLGLFNG
jgi:hypothetical protein